MKERKFCVSVLLDIRTVQKLEDIANKKRKSLSAVARDAIETQLKTGAVA